jgi:hypothetical protein
MLSLESNPMGTGTAFSLIDRETRISDCCLTVSRVLIKLFLGAAEGANGRYSVLSALDEEGGPNRCFKVQ